MSMQIRQIRGAFQEASGMLMHVYSIYNTASGSYMRPFTAHADGEASRLFSDLVADEKHPVGMHPEDYSLYRLGSFNDQNGALTIEGAPECLCTAMELVALHRANDKESR